MKNFFEEPDPLILIPYDASDDGDEKHKFQRFWTWDFENGAKVSLGTTLDDLYKEDSSILALFLRYWQIHEILQNLYITYRSINLCL